MILDFQITTLQDLLEYLPTCHPSEYKGIAKDMVLSESNFDKYATWNSERYTRNCIVRTKRYELILLCWEKGQSTSIHCHGGEECWVYNVKGEIDEKHFILENGLPKPEGNHKLPEGEVSYMNDDLGFHKLVNVSEGRSMTLHLYINPIDSCSSWNAEKKSFLPVDLRYDTYDGKPV